MIFLFQLFLQEVQHPHRTRYLRRSVLFFSRGRRRGAHAEERFAILRACTGVTCELNWTLLEATDKSFCAHVGRKFYPVRLSSASSRPFLCEVHIVNWKRKSDCVSDDATTTLMNFCLNVTSKSLNFCVFQASGVTVTATSARSLRPRTRRTNR